MTCTKTANLNPSVLPYTVPDKLGIQSPKTRMMIKIFRSIFATVNLALISGGLVSCVVEVPQPSAPTEQQKPVIQPTQQPNEVKQKDKDDDDKHSDRKNDKKDDDKDDND